MPQLNFGGVAIPAMTCPSGTNREAFAMHPDSEHLTTGNVKTVVTIGHADFIDMDN